MASEPVYEDWAEEGLLVSGWQLACWCVGSSPRPTPDRGWEEFTARGMHTNDEEKVQVTKPVSSQTRDVSDVQTPHRSK